MSLVGGSACLLTRRMWHSVLTRHTMHPGDVEGACASKTPNPQLGFVSTNVRVCETLHRHAVRLLDKPCADRLEGTIICGCGQTPLAPGSVQRSVRGCGKEKRKIQVKVEVEVKVEVKKEEKTLSKEILAASFPGGSRSKNSRRTGARLQLEGGSAPATTRWGSFHHIAYSRATRLSSRTQPTYFPNIDLLPQSTG